MEWGEWEELGDCSGHYPVDFTNLLTSGATRSKTFLVFEFYIPISNYRIYSVYSVLAFLWFSLYCCAWTIAVFTTNPSIETGQQSNKKILKKYHRLQQCHQISRKTYHSLTRYACFKFQCCIMRKLILWRLAPFVASDH